MLKEDVISEIETTADGSATLYRPDIDEHYHSVKGALCESRHVYIDLAWRHFAAQHSSVRVFEVGFGTGLNAALTARAALETGLATDYFSVELFPLDAQIVTQLYSTQPAELANDFRAVNEAVWNQPVAINRHFSLHKLNDNLLTMRLPESINVVYFDAFAPEKQPEMWSKSLFRALYSAMTDGGVLTTYCAKGAIRRLLQEVGFITERMPGPPGGKREVLRATKPSVVTNEESR